jgi:hypothetical protein
MGEVFNDSYSTEEITASSSPPVALQTHLPWTLIRRGLKGVALATKAESESCVATENALIALIADEFAAHDIFARCKILSRPK